MKTTRTTSKYSGLRWNSGRRTTQKWQLRLAQLHTCLVQFTVLERGWWVQITVSLFVPLAPLKIAFVSLTHEKRFSTSNLSEGIQKVSTLLFIPPSSSSEWWNKHDFTTWFQVSWLRRKDHHLLTVGLTTYSSDERYSAAHLKNSEVSFEGFLRSTLSCGSMLWERSEASESFNEWLKWLKASLFYRVMSLVLTQEADVLFI